MRLEMCISVANISYRAANKRRKETDPFLPTIGLSSFVELPNAGVEKLIAETGVRGRCGSSKDASPSLSETSSLSTFGAMALERSFIPYVCFEF